MLIEISFILAIESHQSASQGTYRFRNCPISKTFLLHRFSETLRFVLYSPYERLLECLPFRRERLPFRPRYLVENPHFQNRFTRKHLRHGLDRTKVVTYTSQLESHFEPLGMHYSLPTRLAKISRYRISTGCVIILIFCEILFPRDGDLLILYHKIYAKEGTSGFAAVETVTDVTAGLGTEKLVVMNFDGDGAAETVGLHCEGYVSRRRVARLGN